VYVVKIKPLGLLFGLLAALAFCADIPVNDSGAVTWTGPTSTPAACYNNTGQSSAWFHIEATHTAGPMDAQVSNDNVHWTAGAIYDKAGTLQSQPFTPPTGTVYRVIPAGVKYVEILPDGTYASQANTANIRCTAANDPFPQPAVSVAVSFPASINVGNFPSPAGTNAGDSGVIVHVANTAPVTLPTSSMDSAASVHTTGACTGLHTAVVSLATTQATNTLLLPTPAAGQQHHICTILLGGTATAVGATTLSISAANGCTSLTTVWEASTGTNLTNVVAGNGGAYIVVAPVNDAVCFGNNAGGGQVVTVEYEDFLRALTPAQLDAFCSIPRRCLLHGLFTTLNRIFDADIP